MIFEIIGIICCGCCVLCYCLAARDAFEGYNKYKPVSTNNVVLSSYNPGSYIYRKVGDEYFLPPV